ncbi:DNA adenine methylase [Kluyvera cryocrescens]|uniref:DNA adenine methylase n=1 Tax=Kluyvera cryocrescens TaxID=580 RepID=UPI0039F5D88E
MSTILKWAGNKTAIMPELKKHLPAGQRLVEPFAGSCAVMMATDYPHYLVADINADLINLYRQIKENTEWFINTAREHFDKDNTPEKYYVVRELFNYLTSISAVEKAAMFLYLNRHGYRGLCRYNKKGHFNVPYGNYKAPYFPENEIRAFAEKAKRATFICASYEETLAMLQAGDVIYCDPPYDGTFAAYHTDGFTDDDQYRLASILEHRSSEGHPVILSNSDTSLTRSLYRNFTLNCNNAKRSMGVAAGEGKSAAEIIAVSKVPVIYSDELPWFGTGSPVGAAVNAAGGAQL